MRVGVVTPWDVESPRAWSGMVKPMVEALRRVADVEIFQTDEVRDSIVDRGLTRLLDGRRGKRYLPGHALATSWKRGRRLSRRLKDRPVDAIISIAASQDIAFLDTDIPVVQVSDTTYRSIRDFYPLFSNLNPLSSFQADVQSRRSAARTSHTLAATGWARDALVRDDGFRPDDVTLAHFGPAIHPDGSEPERTVEGPLKVLMVSSDWERKGGPDVLATWDELRTRGVHVELTVVGDAPPMPADVRALGRVDSDEMRRLYATSHVLLEMSRSDAASATLTDAAAFGLPVVSADTEGVSSIVVDGSTGFLVPAGDAAAAADRLQELLDPALRGEMSDACLRRSREVLNWDMWAQQALTTLERVARSGNGDGSIVMLSPAIPYPGIEHAGGQYLRRLQDALTASASTTWLVQDRPSVRHALEQPGVTKDVVLLGDTESGSQWRRRTYRLADRVEQLWRKADSQPIPFAPVIDLLTLPAARRAIRQATVLDFQWAPWTKLAPLARRLNGDARLTFTFHDVMSQKAARSRDKAPDALRRLKWRIAHFLARRWERRALRIADAVMVFSEKDKQLLDPDGKHRNIHVIDPPLADGEATPHSPNDDARVLFVGFMARPENVDALRWFTDRVWPKIRTTVPDGSLLVAGGGTPDEVTKHYENNDHGIELLGFVPDLGAEYARASVVVVPLLHGAGVKFKTIEALLEGVPVVTTAIGAEGIGVHSLFEAVTEDADDFAAAVVTVLADNEAAVQRAESGQSWAWGRYGVEAFSDRIRTLYSTSDL